MSNASSGTGKAHVLVVEDSSVFREMQGLLLRQAGYEVSLHETPQAALTAATRQVFDLVVIDYELPEMNGQQFMHGLRKLQPDIAVVFVSGALTLELAIQLSSQGVAGIFNKPANPKVLLEKINETLARSAVRDTAARMGSNAPIAPRRNAGGDASAGAEPAADRLAYVPRFLLGQSDVFREFSHRLWKVRDFRAALLLHGEAGSPFEAIARDLAEISIFRDGPVMLCRGADFETRTLIEALAPSLLSHDAGTLVVTGVEQFSAAQQKTLENLMTGRDVFLPFARRFRIVLAATNELTDRVDDGSFNETLYYKISALSLSVPTLREMRPDIVTNSLRILAGRVEAGNAGSPLTFTPEAAAWLEAKDWPGNFDQLSRTLLTAAKHQTGSDALTVSALESAAREIAKASAVRSPAPAVAPAPLRSAGEPGPTAEARPPFPITSAIAPETKPTPPAAPATAPKPLTAQSLFRPASASFTFATRLTEALAAAAQKPEA
jgi:two-component system nitrogen regulation response regulator NtrX